MQDARDIKAPLGETDGPITSVRELLAPQYITKQAWASNTELNSLALRSGAPLSLMRRTLNQPLQKIVGWFVTFAFI